MEVPQDDVSVDLRRVLFEIAYALDAVGVDDIYHGHRVAYIAYRCAQRMGWSEERCQVIFSLGLIHDCGVSESAEIGELLTTLAPKNTRKHCVKGYELLKACRPLSELATPILLHHTWWQELKVMHSVSEDIKQYATLLFLADRVDYLHGNYGLDCYGNISKESTHSIVGELQANSGSMFEPTQVRFMSELIHCDDFWFSMEARYIESLSYTFEPLYRNPIGLDESIEVAELFAQIVDAKSSFTYQHSLHVAQLAEFFAHKLGYSERARKMLYLAGLIHDIGKLKTPSAILHKPAQLSNEEYVCIKRHATDSRHAIQRMFTNQQIVEWASNHHERLDGSGYPLGLDASRLDEPSRLIAITDVFQALTQSRPYRKGLPLGEAVAILKEMVSSNQLDRKIFKCLVDNAEECYRISTGQESEKPVLV
ncbi:HD-GYP domain-containing protein [Vibrio sp. VPAP30]|uniref:HD-GYP domain-containing protein n=1 Tax=Vibrio sp. VPAP30 TaxID=1647102 RepID=UPI00065A0BDB|nr:HD domain-containing phosphohydrolase [Vibrio sp. VPAP30]KLN66709.1 metal-dependent phosphohydrolase with tandem HD motifs [Vibrio sp. VPAP30]